MPALANAKHEAFARAIVEGKSGRAAYRAAGYRVRARVADAAASRLLADVNVSARVAELKAEAAQGAVATAREVLEELTRIAFANMKTYVADDDTTKPISELTDAQASIIQERIVEHYAEGDGDGRRVVTKVRFKLCDKLGALRDLGRHHKLFTDKTEHTGTLSLEAAVAASLGQNQAEGPPSAPAKGSR
jgi:phage terminase small subunit